MFTNITLEQNEIAEFCKHHHISKLSLFGSILRDNFRPDSDVDVLVEFIPGYIPGFITFSRMQRELSEILGRQVDLRTPESLSDYFRDEVEANAELIYEQG